MKFGWFKALDKPIDFGFKFGKADLFGPNKNWRGALIYIIGGTLVTYLLHLMQTSRNWIAPVFGNNPLILGLAFCSTYVLGELVNSFIKRRIGIAPGSGGNFFQKFIDNTDGALATGLVFVFMYKVPIELLLGALAISLVIHAATDSLMRRLRLKSK
ncbi:MAG: CDP-archaeol synthase [Actinobacteria bacterium]|nr:CDP-archaeol synthase [Actinomycetota bacterium]